MRREFSASPGKTAGPLLAMRVIAGLFGLAAAAFWQNWLLAGLFMAVTLLCSLAAGVLAYRILARPVMLRIDESGIFMKRLAVTVPWQALSHVERIDLDGETVHALVETEGGHPVFAERGLMVGAALNARAGLPPLAVTMSTYDGTPDEFEAAVAAIGGLQIVDQT